MESPVKTDRATAVPVRVGQSQEVAIRCHRSGPDAFLLAATMGIDLGPTILGVGRLQSLDDILT
jgi:hypothetical protein